MRLLTLIRFTCRSASVSSRSRTRIATIDPFVNQVDPAVGCDALNAQLRMSGKKKRLAIALGQDVGYRAAGDIR